MKKRTLLFLALGTILALSVPMAIYGQHASGKSGNTVTVITEGYVKAIEGRTLIPGTSDNGARNVAGTVALVKGKMLLSSPTPEW